MTHQIAYTAALSDLSKKHLEMIADGTARNFPRQIKGRLDTIKADFQERFALAFGSAEAELLESLGNIRPLPIADEIDLAVKWIVERDEVARKGLVMSHFPRLFRITLKGKSGGDDWLDILHDAIVDALLAADNLSVYDYEDFNSQTGLQVLHKRIRHVLNYRRGVAGSRTLHARRAASRILHHSLEEISSGAVSVSDIERSSRNKPTITADVQEVMDFLLAEDESEMPETASDGGLEQVEMQIDVHRVAACISSALDPRAARIIEARWLTHDRMSAEALAFEFGITPERVRQIERLSLQDLRAHLEGRKTTRQIVEERDEVRVKRKRKKVMSIRVPKQRIVKGVDIFKARPVMKKVIGENGMEVLSRRYFTREKPIPFADIAQDMSLTCSQVRSLEARSLNLLRQQFSV